MWINGWGDLPGHLVVVSGPSGSGKSSLVRGVVARGGLDAQLSVSVTTRRPRPDEREGVDYRFVDDHQWQSIRGDPGTDGLLEFAEYNEQYYGTPARPVFEAIGRGKTILLEIEVKGAIQIRERAPTSLFVFVKTPRFADLADRLRARGTEDPAAIHRRLVRARAELAESHWYDAVIVNDDLDRATDELASLLLDLKTQG